MTSVIVLFFVTALAYASVGFGGGSTYSAILVLAKTDYQILPSLVLLCNLIVVSGGAYKFARAGHVNFKRIAPWVVTSIPAAWLGGYLKISEILFVGLLGGALLVAALRMLVKPVAEQGNWHNIYADNESMLAPLIGAVLGLLAGLVGIGGGVFLAPVLYLLRWGDARMIAATCSVFIFLNSLSGLFGQVMKLGDMGSLSNMAAYWALFPAVFVGGQIGSHMGATRIEPDFLRKLTAVLILYVSGRLLFRWWGMVF